MKYKLPTAVFLFITVSLFGTNPMGTWRTHLSYSSLTLITQSNNKVYGISSGALFSVSKKDETVTTYSKKDGLSDNNIQYIKYSENNRLLVIVYSNSNIDLMTDDGIVYNISDLYRKKLSSSKTVNNILFIGSQAYLSCDFGILVLNLDKHDIADTYIIGDNGSNVSVKALDTINNRFYAVGEKYIYTADRNDNNLANYQNWDKISMPSTTNTNKTATEFNGALYILQSDSTVQKWTTTSGWQPHVATNITQICSNDGVLFYLNDNSLSTTLNGKDFNYTFGYPRYALYDKTNQIFWVATYYSGIAKQVIGNNTNNYYKPNGTPENRCWRMVYSQGRLFVVPGGRFAVQYNWPGRVMIYENGTWKTIEQTTINNATNSNCVDLVDVAVDPSDKTHFWTASYGKGLYEFRHDEPYKLYNAANSAIETIFPNGNTTQFYDYNRIDGLRYDNNGNLWLVNANAANSPIKFIDNSGTFHSLDCANLTDYATPKTTLIDNTNPHIKWVLFERGTSTNNSAIAILDDNGTPTDISDDRINVITTTSTNPLIDQDGNRFTPTRFESIAQDNDGNMWVGTTEGPIILDATSKAFSKNYGCTRIKIPRNDGTNLADYLLGSEQINEIAIDGANRKWLCTETSGVYLVSDDGLATVHHFTSENSPLLSDNVLSIAIDSKSGEVFFGTDNGIISYQSDATKPEETFTNVHAYPNPVRETYRGTITITGLVENTNVKITDINGDLVYETMSNGGIATWDGTRKGGLRVATGIYPVICTNSDGSQHAICKILIIN